MKTFRHITWQQWATLTSCLAAILLAHMLGDATFVAVCGVISTIVLAVTRRFGDPPKHKRLPYEIVEMRAVRGGKDV